jgi:hypothetical protein
VKIPVHYFPVALKNMDVVIVFESYPKSGNKQLKISFAGKFSGS